MCKAGSSNLTVIVCIANWCLDWIVSWSHIFDICFSSINPTPKRKKLEGEFPLRRKPLSAFFLFEEWGDSIQVGVSPQERHVLGCGRRHQCPINFGIWITLDWICGATISMRGNCFGTTTLVRGRPKSWWPFLTRTSMTVEQMPWCSRPIRSCTTCSTTWSNILQLRRPYGLRHGRNTLWYWH